MSIFKATIYLLNIVFWFGMLGALIWTDYQPKGFVIGAAFFIVGLSYVSHLLDEVR